MTILQQLGRNVEAHEVRAGAGEFCKLARILLAADGRLDDAAGEAQRQRAKPRIVEILRSAVQPANVGDWGALADYQIISSAFSESLRSLSVFDAMLPSIVPAPLRSRGVVITTGITGSSPSERSIKPISSMSLGSSLVDVRKAAAIVITSLELARSADANTQKLFDSELRKAVVAAIDSVFLAALIAATTPTASAGSTLANITTDVGVLLSAVTTHANSALFFIASPTNMKKLALKASSIGSPAYPGIGPNGGTLLPGVIAVASDQIASDAALLVDATQLAGSAEAFRLDASEQGAIQMDTSPDSPPTASTAPISLWQSNLRALRCERYFGFTLLRTSAVASLSSVSY